MTVDLEHWAIGYSGSAKKHLRSNDGVNWFDGGSPGSLPSGEQGTHLHGTNYNDVWFAGGGRVYHYNGAIFDYISPYSTWAQSYGIRAVDTEYVWFCGFWSPRSWLWQPSTGFIGKTVPDSRYVYNIWAYDRTHAWAAGSGYTTASRGRIWYWDGITWTTVWKSEDLPGGDSRGGLTWVHGTDPNNVWFGGMIEDYSGATTGDNRFRYNVIKWNGSTFAPKNYMPDLNTYGCYFGWTDGPDFVIVRRNAGGTGSWITHYNGTSWGNKKWLAWPYGGARIHMVNRDYAMMVNDASNHYVWEGVSWSPLSLGIGQTWDYTQSNSAMRNLWITDPYLPQYTEREWSFTAKDRFHKIYPMLIRSVRDKDEVGK